MTMVAGEKHVHGAHLVDVLKDGETADIFLAGRKACPQKVQGEDREDGNASAETSRVR